MIPKLLFRNDKSKDTEITYILELSECPVDRNRVSDHSTNSTIRDNYFILLQQ